MLNNKNSKHPLIIFLASLFILILMGSSQMLLAQPTQDDALFIDASGNVGIGNPSPLGPLSIGNSAIRGSDGFLVIGKHNKVGGGTRHFKIGFDDKFDFTIGDYGNNNNAGTWKSPFSINYAAPDASFHINRDGNVGIGTTTPGSFNLNVSGSSNFTGALRGTSATFSGPVLLNGSQGNFRIEDQTDAKIHFVRKTGDQKWQVGTNANEFYIFNENNKHTFLINYGTGYVGIGERTPKAPLHVAGSSEKIYAKYRWMSGAMGKAFDVVDSGVLDRSFSIIADGNIKANQFFQISDQRIKIIQSKSEASLDLSTLLKLEVVDYNYKDIIANDYRAKKGVIAQQIEKFLPIAITRSTDVVPDIYQKASFKDRWVMLETDLKKGDNVRIIGENNEGVYEVLEVNKAKFRTNFIGEEAQVFVYGREVNDFLSVDYDAISMLNVSATQEIARQMEQLQAENKEQATRITELEKQIEDMETLKAAVAKLQSKLNGEMMVGSN